VEHIVGKLSTRAITLLQTSPQSKVLKNVMGFQNYGSPNLGVSEQNDIWVHALWPGIENTIREKVVVSSKFESW